MTESWRGTPSDPEFPEFQIKAGLVRLKTRRERDINGSDLADACANLIFSRGDVWDEPPCSYWVYKTRKGLVLRDTGMPDWIVSPFGTPGRYLNALARMIADQGIAPPHRPGEQVAGFVFRSEIWEVFQATKDQAKVDATMELVRRRRLYTHPDRIEARMAAGALIGEDPWMYSLQRGKEMISALQTTPSPGADMTPPGEISLRCGVRTCRNYGGPPDKCEKGHTEEPFAEGDIPDGIYLICRALSSAQN
jgi:hypothetical protein